ncbi:NUDIX domain-containing protein [Thiomicrorhabdus sp. zzn3]|uniref:NUDIX domain-containing protein n=1 Tax=Thiomicrorhabdus sp. zzn3 TaxID=3039775 RepID=UPI00243668E9|nr:NUDIX domain-containing protein [Thiomicrorhabdus sp. zzn3]MDG6778773.1 NUDIX domain-containing protein [Thiomicrorhabdus sp. zzn3]
MIRIKNCAKAVIIENQKVLLLKKQYANEKVIYTLPGGTQEPGESLIQTVIREVLEEADVHIEVRGLFKIYEHQRTSKTEPENIKHKVEFAFLATLSENAYPQNGCHPDPHQLSVEWIAINQLKQLRLDPPFLAEVILSAKLPEVSPYLDGLNKSDVD